jgi:hypothetical protein
VDFSLQRHAEAIGQSFHRDRDNLAGLLDYCLRDFQEDPVMHGQKHPHDVRQGIVQADQHQFEQIGGGTLDEIEPASGTILAFKTKGIPIYLYVHPSDGHDVRKEDQEWLGWNESINAPSATAWAQAKFAKRNLQENCEVLRTTEFIPWPCPS